MMDYKKMSDGGYHCIVCGKSSGTGRIYDHVEGHRISKEQKAAVRKCSEAIAVRMRSAILDCREIPHARTQFEYEIIQFFIKKLRDFGIPIINKTMVRKPSTHTTTSAVPPTASSNMSAELLTNVKDLVDVLRSPANASQSSTSITSRPRREAALNDFTRPDIALATNVLEREETYEERNDRQFEGKETVHVVFLQPIQEMFAYDWVSDDWRKTYYTQDYTPRGDLEISLDGQIRFWRKLVPEQHPLLLGFKNHLENLHNDRNLLPADLEEHKAFQHMYNTNVARFMLIAMRARQRYGETVSIDDVLFSCPTFEMFMDFIVEQKVKEGVQEQFVKAMIRFLEYTRKVTNPSVFNGLRASTYISYKEQLAESMERSGNRITSNKSKRGAVTAYTKTYTPYPVACALVSHRSITAKIEEINNRRDVCTVAEFDFVLGAALINLIVFNTTRNEIGRKLLCGSIRGQKDPRGFIYKDTGFREIAHDGNTYYVSYYACPKTLRGMRSRSALLGGLFAADERIKRILDVYHNLKEARLTILRKKGGLANDRPFFLSFDGRPLPNPAYNLQSFLRLAGIPDQKISCNGVRHSTAQMQFDSWCEQHLSGGVDADVALLAGHSVAVQETEYTDDLRMRAIRGFLRLRKLELADEFKDEVKRVTDMTSLPIVDLTDEKLVRRLKSDARGTEITLHVAMAETENSDGEDEPHAELEAAELAGPSRSKVPGTNVVQSSQSSPRKRLHRDTSSEDIFFDKPHK